MVGFTYEVATTVANYLMAEGAAVPVADDRPALVLPIDEVAELLPGHDPISKAADKPPRRK